MSKGIAEALELVLLNDGNSSKKREKLYILQTWFGLVGGIVGDGQDSLEIGAGWLRLERWVEPEC